MRLLSEDWNEAMGIYLFFSMALWLLSVRKSQLHSCTGETLQRVGRALQLIGDIMSLPFLGIVFTVIDNNKIGTGADAKPTT
jgi:hypothetical protein